MQSNNNVQAVKKLVEQLREYLVAELGYTAGTLHTYAAPWDGLVWFAAQRGITKFTPEFGENFLREYYGIPGNPCPLINTSRSNINKYVRAIRTDILHVPHKVLSYGNGS